ncbi:MAG: GPR endopeptidase [Lachnospiraceae bacterium]|nr:GPR endopeptidase [Lachnospiraceae bacterium]
MIARTDLAVELQEDVNQESSLEGIRMKTKIDTGHHIKETKIVIENEKGSKLLGKPIGTYITLECHDLQENDFSYHEEMSTVLSEHLQLLLPHRKRVLIAGLGNRNVTPDALGPYVIDHLFITGHLQKHGYYHGTKDIRAICPGVMAQTGMETGEILKGIIDETKAEVLIAIDALSARNSKRLNTTIQISNTGIQPGAGIGNHRKGINEQTMGIPVIAIGVPTVISISTILYDAMEFLVEEDMISEEQQFQFVHGSLDESIAKMFVTPKNVDEAVQRISFTISEGINQWIVKEEE